MTYFTCFLTLIYKYGTEMTQIIYSATFSTTLTILKTKLKHPVSSADTIIQTIGLLSVL